jgi:membrane protein implicated in regulation of membrane protease activity
MKLALLIGILVTVAALSTLLVIALYFHKKGSSGDISLMGRIAEVQKQLDPEGTVIVGGELWRAKSKDGALISAHQRVRVVGFEGHLALVEICE